MCKLRCYVQNYGREKVIVLVAWKREKEYQELKKTGTDDISLPVKRREITKAEREAYAYVERMQASLGENTTVRKALAIKEQIYI